MRKSSIGGPPQRVRADNTTHSRNPSRERPSLIGRPSISGYGNSRLSSYGNQRQSSVNQFSAIPKLGRPSSGIGVRGRTDVIKDTRPIYDKKYQAQCIRQLLEFLISHQYPHPISQKLLELPSAKDFFKIFEFCVGQYWFGYKQVPKMEEEVPRVLKLIGYPFTISKTQLMSAGSPHTWPHLLAALIWIIETLPMTALNIENHGGIDAFIFETSESETVSLEKIIFDDSIRTYLAFMSGADTFEEQNTCVEKILLHKLQGFNVEELNDENTRLETELALMEQSKKKRRKIQEAIENLKCDFKLLSAYVSNLRDYRKNIETENKTLEDELGMLSANLQSEREKLTKLQEVYEKQSLSPADVERLKAEQDSLKLEVDKLEKAIANIDADIWEKSMKQAKINEEVEKEASTYNRIAIGLKLVPETTELARGRDFRLYSGFSSDPVGAFDNTVKPMLLTLKKSTEDSIRKKEKYLFQLKGDNEQCSEGLTELKATLEKIEKELHSLDEEIESLKKLSQSDKMSVTNEIESVQQEIRNLEDRQRQVLEEKDRLTEELKRLTAIENVKKEEVVELTATLDKDFTKICNDAEDYKNSVEQQMDIYTETLQAKVMTKRAHIKQLQEESRDRERRLDLMFKNLH
ncbi:kinetochore protein NDC80 [Biomphalaria pfeifferi]|uniref:Kinetochore protein NDC80 n=1 Tax=Biomphalaria pfeifferi TaxID=112525 RepID=A0AAD8B3M7_BIOPF|nr:kinetochore protein NDC80 [Biomphalaria pfeifferi]